MIFRWNQDISNAYWLWGAFYDGCGIGYSAISALSTWSFFPFQFSFVVVLSSLTQASILANFASMQNHYWGNLDLYTFVGKKKKLRNALLFSLSGWSQIACGAELIYSIQAFGRTPLTNISPKKTLEGALAGLSGCILITLILSKILCWPTSLLRYSVCCSKLWKLTSKVQVCLHLVISYRNSTYFLFYQIGSLHLCQIRWITSSSFVDLIYRF